MNELREKIKETIELNAGVFLDEEAIEDLTDHIMDDVRDAVHSGVLMD